MTRLIFSILIVTLALIIACNKKTDTPIPRIKNEIRAPAYPLLSIDPFTTVWSMGDTLYQDIVRHTTGRQYPLTGAIRVDGRTFYFMGLPDGPLQALAPASVDGEWTGKYNFTQPETDWTQPDYKDDNWRRGLGSFGTFGMKNVKTLWPTNEIWIRREVEIDEETLRSKNIYLQYSQDCFLDLYINGVSILKTGGDPEYGTQQKLPDSVLSRIVDGRIVIAAHGKNRNSTRMLDFGIYASLTDKSTADTLAVQKSVQVQPTQTIYLFECGGVELNVSFIAPFIPDDISIFSRPINYITYEINSVDQKEHTVEMYFEAGPAWSADLSQHESQAQHYTNDNLVFAKTGSKTQKLFGRKGEELKIDWGYFYMCGEKSKVKAATGTPHQLRQDFSRTGTVAVYPDTTCSSLVLTTSFDRVLAGSGKIMLGYDEGFAIQYYGENLRPFWNKNGKQTIEQEFAKATKDYEKVVKSTAMFDLNLMRQAYLAGGKNYAELCALAYRHTLASFKLVSADDGKLLYLAKDGNSIVGIYTASPLFLLYSPLLLKAMLNPIFDSSEKGDPQKRYPAHDMGEYPVFNAPVFRWDMPIEDCGNMLIMVAAIARIEGSAAYAEAHWETLSVWADYLVEHANTSSEQVYGDAIFGPLAQGTNLAVKSILGIASFAQLAATLGKGDIAQNYRRKADAMAMEWQIKAIDGDHYKMAFHQQDTWSMKYNLVWDDLLGLHVFPDSISKMEIRFYRKKQEKFGIPLDSRDQITRANWQIWTAALNKDVRMFDEMIKPLYRLINETPNRVPMLEWYYTNQSTNPAFRTGLTPGGYFMKLLKFSENAQFP